MKQGSTTDGQRQALNLDNRPRGYIELPRWVIRDRRLDGNLLRVLCAVMARARQRTCRVTQARLAADLGVSRFFVGRRLERLRGLKLLDVVKVPGEAHILILTFDPRAGARRKVTQEGGLSAVTAHPPVQLERSGVERSYRSPNQLSVEGTLQAVTRS